MNEQRINLDLFKHQTPRSCIALGQGDHNGTTLVATLYDNGQPLDTTGVTAVHLVMRLPTGVTYYREQATLSGNVATVVINEARAAAHVGTVRDAYFQIMSGAEVVASTSRFDVRILRSALDGLTPGENYDSAIEHALDAMADAAEAESARVAAESSRISAEQGRVAAEISRTSDESSRASAESARISNENARKSAETSRASAESGRVNAESARSIAEGTRATAEQSRVSAEHERQVASNSAVSAANMAATNAQSVADGLIAAKARGDFDAEVANVTVTVGQTIGEASAEVTLGGRPGAQTFNFAFDGVKGEPGDTHSFAISKDGNTITLAGTDASTSSVTFTNADIIALLGYIPAQSSSGSWLGRNWEDIDATSWGELP